MGANRLVCLNLGKSNMLLSFGSQRSNLPAVNMQKGANHYPDERLWKAAGCYQHILSFPAWKSSSYVESGKGSIKSGKGKLVVCLHLLSNRKRHQTGVFAKINGQLIK